MHDSDIPASTIEGSPRDKYGLLLPPFVSIFRKRFIARRLIRSAWRVLATLLILSMLHRLVCWGSTSVLRSSGAGWIRVPFFVRDLLSCFNATRRRPLWNGLRRSSPRRFNSCACSSQVIARMSKIEVIRNIGKVMLAIDQAFFASNQGMAWRDGV